MLDIVDKLLKHIPEMDEFDQEYPWSIAIGKIKNKKSEWLEIEQQLIIKRIGLKHQQTFLKNIMNALIGIKTERFLNKNHDQYDTKEQLLHDLKRIKDNISTVQKNFGHQEYHDILRSYTSSTLEDDNFSFEDGINQTAESLQNIENALEQMSKAADQAIRNYTQQKALRPVYSTLKKNLKNDLALFIAKELQKIGINPTKTRDGFFDKIFCYCCDIIEVGPNKAGSKHVEKAVELLNRRRLSQK